MVLERASFSHCDRDRSGHDVLLEFATDRHFDRNDPGGRKKHEKNGLARRSSRHDLQFVAMDDRRLTQLPGRGILDTDRDTNRFGTGEEGR